MVEKKCIMLLVDTCYIYKVWVKFYQRMQMRCILLNTTEHLIDLTLGKGVTASEVMKSFCRVVGHFRDDLYL